MTQDPRQLDSQELQSKTRSLRALARSLVGDEHQAEDVVQETWVTALDRPPRKRGIFGAWLSGVTKNHARQQSREETRRDRREQKAARPEFMPSDDSIERLDTLRHILDQVRGMDEPYRTTLLMRYFDELSAQEIAEQQGVPYATVRTRLHRALEKLRQRMDEASGGSREAWVTPLLPFISAGAAVATAATATAAGSASLGAGKAATVGSGLKLKFGIGAAVLALGTGSWLALPLLDFSSDDPVVFVEGEEEHGANAEEVALSRQVALTEEEAKGPITGAGKQRIEVEFEETLPSKAASKGKTIRIEGRVIARETGQGIANASIIIGREKDIHTDETGRFAKDVYVPDGRGKSSDKTQGSRKGGKKDSSPTGNLWIRCMAPGFITQWEKRKTPGDGSPLHIDFALDEALVVSGFVLDSEGKGIEGALVRTFRKAEKRVLTDAEGGFRIDDLDPESKKTWLFASAKGYTAKGMSLDLDDEGMRHGIRITLQLGSRIHGFVQTKDRMPIEGAVLELSSKDKVRAVSDAKGAFELHSVGTGLQRLSVRHKDYAAQVREVQIASAGNDVEVRFQLDEGVRLTGRLRDRAGRGVPHARLMVLQMGQRLADAKSDEQGRFEIERMPASEVGLYVTAEGFLPLWRPDLLAGSRPLDLEMYRGAGLAGRVFDAHTGLPIQAFSVRLIGPAEVQDMLKRRSMIGGKDRIPTAALGNGKGGFKDLGKWIGTTLKIRDEKGHWSTGKTVLPEGMRVALSISAKGYANKRIPAALTKVGAHPEDLPVGMDRGAVLQGRVIAQASSAAVSKARIRLLPPGERLQSRGIAKQRLASASSDENGRFTFENLSSGDYRFVVEHADWGMSVHAVEIPAGQAIVQFTLRLDEQSSLSGFAYGLDGRMHALEPLELTAVQVPGLRNKSWRTRSDATGKFTFSQLPLGIYRLSAGDSGARSRMQQFGKHVTISTKGAHETVLRPTGPCSIRGTIRSTVQIPGTVIVSLTPIYPKDHPWDKREARRDVRVESGSFHFPALATGKYRLRSVVYVPSERAMLIGTKEIEIHSTTETRTELVLEATSTGK